jgi:hypothetical protein
MTEELEALETRLSMALRNWWDQINKEYLELSKDPKDFPTKQEDLWNDLPVIDSIVVVETIPIFVDIIGIPLDVTLIRHSYNGIDELISDLVPQMLSRI